MANARMLIQNRDKSSVNLIASAKGEATSDCGKVNVEPLKILLIRACVCT